ncbi:S41 family peptidase [Bacillus sp. SL00103]
MAAQPASQKSWRRLCQSSGIKMIGEKTFGKGTVQNAQSYNDGSSVKLTIAKWLTPDGSWIHKKELNHRSSSTPKLCKGAILKPEKTYQLNDNGDEVKAVKKCSKRLTTKQSKW